MAEPQADITPGTDPAGGFKRYILWGGVVVVMLMIVSLPSVIIVGVGMLPTIVAALIDRTEKRYASFCVGGMNLSGVFPYLLTIWTDDHSVGAAGRIVTDVFSLGVMFSSAGFGWLLFIAIPPVISAFLNVIAESRMKTLITNQKNILEEWGDDIAAGSGEGKAAPKTEPEEATEADTGAAPPTAPTPHTAPASEPLPEGLAPPPGPGP